MTRTLLDRPPRRTLPPPRWAFAVLLALAGVLTFCHGCHNHGDDDLAGAPVPGRRAPGP